VDVLEGAQMVAVAKFVVSNFGSRERRAELFSLISSRSFKTGKFTLSSGKESSLYFNMKPTMMWPRGAELAARELLEIARLLDVEYVGGLEMGAVPVIGSMAAMGSVEKQPLKTFFVRKEPKKHGTKDLLEGLGPDESLKGKRVLIVDDVATSGQSILKAINASREVGGIVEHAACLVNRDEGADFLLAESGVRLHSVFRADDFVGTR
jgi:orotate phosphoribosyltransferase